MALDTETVRRVARLARIRVSDDEIESLSTELQHIMGWIDQLNEVDTANVEPMTSAVEMGLRWREDGVTDGGAVDDVLANAPARSDAFYTVPKVVE